MALTRGLAEFSVIGASVKPLAFVFQIGESQVVTALEKSTLVFNTSRKTHGHVDGFIDAKLNGRFRCRPVIDLGRLTGSFGSVPGIGRVAAVMSRHAPPLVDIKRQPL